MSQITINTEQLDDVMNKIGILIGNAEAYAQRIYAVTQRPAPNIFPTLPRSPARPFDMSVFTRTSAFAEVPFNCPEPSDPQGTFSAMDSVTTTNLETLFSELGNDYSEEVITNLKIFYGNLYILKESWIQAEQEAASQIERSRP